VLGGPLRRRGTELQEQACSYAHADNFIKNLCWTVAVSPGPRQHTSARGRGSCPTATLRYARGADERWRWSSCHQLCSGLRSPWVVACWSFPESDARVHPLLASAICGGGTGNRIATPRHANVVSQVWAVPRLPRARPSPPPAVPIINLFIPPCRHGAHGAPAAKPHRACPAAQRRVQAAAALQVY
jgi:hypothetical protein